MSDFLSSFLSGGPTSIKQPRSIITERSVRRELREALVEGIFLSGEKVAVLLSILESSEREPFNDSFLTSSDLGAMGLEVAADAEERGKGFVFNVDDVDDEDDFDDPIPVTAAVTAPDNTPSGNEPIPPEVLNSLKVLQEPAAENPALAGKPVTGLIQQENPVSASVERDVKIDSGYGKRKVSEIFGGSGEELAVSTSEDNSNDIMTAFEAVNAVKSFRKANVQEHLPKLTRRKDLSEMGDAVSPEAKKAYEDALSRL